MISIRILYSDIPQYFCIIPQYSMVLHFQKQFGSYNHLIPLWVTVGRPDPEIAMVEVEGLLFAKIAFKSHRFAQSSSRKEKMSDQASFPKSPLGGAVRYFSSNSVNTGW